MKNSNNFNKSRLEVEDIGKSVSIDVHEVDGSLTTYKGVFVGFNMVNEKNKLISGVYLFGENTANDLSEDQVKVFNFVNAPIMNIKKTRLPLDFGDECRRLTKHQHKLLEKHGFKFKK